MMAVLELWAAQPGEDSLTAVTDLILRITEHTGEILNPPSFL